MATGIFSVTLEELKQQADEFGWGGKTERIFKRRMSKNSRCLTGEGRFAMEAEQKRLELEAEERRLHNECEAGRRPEKEEK